VWLIAGSATPLRASEDAALRHARELLRRVPLVDGHNDLPWELRESAVPGALLPDLRQRRQGDTDIPRLREGQVAGQFWSVWVPSQTEGGFARTQLEQIDVARRMIAAFPDVFALATRAADLETARRQGRIASFLGMENGLAIENSLGALRTYYELGVRYMTLTHGRGNDWADSATDEARHAGLTPFGREVVREMNRLGMLVDISHVSPAVMHQALDVSEAPVIFSHSSARALVDHPRNVPDDVLARMKANGGVVMVTFIPSFVSREAAEWGRPLEHAAQGGPRRWKRSTGWSRSTSARTGPRRRPRSRRWPTTSSTWPGSPAPTTWGSAATSRGSRCRPASRTSAATRT
jgi:membrane dipeptidase